MSRNVKDAHALQRVIQAAAARMCKDTPPAQTSERAVRALTGQLASLPPYVIDAFELTQTLSDWIVDVAISKSGKIAILLGQHTDEDSSNVFLTIWPRPRGDSELLNLGLVKDNATVRVLFPEGSDTPAVVIGGEKIVWGNWTLELPWKDELEVPKSACLTMLQDSECVHVWYIDDGVVSYTFFSGTVIDRFQPFGSSDSNKTRWLGLVGGELAHITVECDQNNVRETIHWRNVNKAMSMWNEQIVPASIGCVGDGIQFVTMRNFQFTAYQLSADHTWESEWMSSCFFGDGRIFMYYRGDVELPRHAVHSICGLAQGGGWVEAAEMEVGQACPEVGSRVHDFGDHVAIVDQHERRHDRLITVWPSAYRLETSVIIGGPTNGYVRVHHGLLYQTNVTGTSGFIWTALDNVPGKRPLTKSFPLYNRFDTLTPVEDERGKAIMGWGYAEGTFCVIRYPLPTQ